MAMLVEHEDRRVKITTDTGVEFYFEQTGDGQRVQVWGPHGLKVQPVVGNVIELEGRP